MASCPQHISIQCNQPDVEYFENNAEWEQWVVIEEGEFEGDVIYES